MEFSLHTYINRLREMGASDEFLETVRRHAKPLADRKVPVILTLGQLAATTGVSYHFLLAVIKRNVDPYRVFQIRKRSGGRRFICVPESQLLSVQRWIHEFILRSPEALKRLSPNSTAYSPGSSHIFNAKRHVGASWVLKLDATRFFESISERQVYLVFRQLGYRALVAFCLTRVCTRVVPPDRDIRLRNQIARWQTGSLRKYLASHLVGHLPQGAATSPMLANLVCPTLDAELEHIAAREGLTYSRYADDMTFSGSIRGRSASAILIGEISKIVGAHGLGINPKKTSITKNGSRKIVTGLSVDGDEVRVPRSYKDKIRQELFFLEKHGLEGHCARIGQKRVLPYLRRLKGRIRYIATIEPSIGNRMLSKFERMYPMLDEIEHLIAS